jgi:uncharacterized phage protein gp47/JayE
MAAIPFTRETASAYAASMIARFLGLSRRTAGRLTDFNPGSNIRSFFETIGLLFEHLDSKVAALARRAIPSILYEFFGDGDGVTTDVGFPALPALAATTVVRYVRAPAAMGAIPIALGARLQAAATPSQPARTYVTTAAVVMAETAGTVDVIVRCTQAGRIGSAPAESLQVLDAIPGIASATNLAATQGQDAETDESRRLRFGQWVRNLARAQEAGLEVGALDTTRLLAGVVVERVVSANAVARAEKRGLVDVFIDNGAGSASAALVDEVQRVLDGGLALDGSRIHGYKAASVTVVVQAVSQQVVPVTVAIRVDGRYRFVDVQPAVSAAIGEYLFALGAGVALIHADLVATIAQVAGVADLALTSPTANVPASLGARLLPGVLTVTENPLL